VGLDLVQPGPHGGNGLVTQTEDPHPGVLVTPFVSDDSRFEQQPEVLAADPVGQAGQGWSPARAIARVSGTPSISRLVIVAGRAPRVPFDRSLSAMANTAP